MPLRADRLTRPMVERRRGGIIAMASGATDGGSSYIVTHAATKAFDPVFAEGLWLEMSPNWIDVTAVMPGSVRTPGFRGVAVMASARRRRWNRGSS